MTEDTEKCPYCGTTCYADWCDVGVPGAMQQVGPYHCDRCGASEIGPYDKARELTEQEKKHGWYAPGAEPGSSANVIDGKIVGYKQMRDAYYAEFFRNPLWHDKSYVANWWNKIRKGFV